MSLIPFAPFFLHPSSFPFVRGVYYEAYTELEDAEGREKFLKSGAGRRLLRAQLRQYLKRFPARARGFDHASTSD
jgi:hypothetical protein